MHAPLYDLRLDVTTPLSHNPSFPASIYPQWHYYLPYNIHFVLPKRYMALTRFPGRDLHAALSLRQRLPDIVSCGAVCHRRWEGFPSASSTCISLAVPIWLVLPRFPTLFDLVTMLAPPFPSLFSYQTKADPLLQHVYSNGHVRFFIIESYLKALIAAAIMPRCLHSTSATPCRSAL